MLSCILVIALFLGPSCGYSARWQETPIDGHWVAPGVQAQQFQRTRSPVAAPREEVVTFWTDSKGQRVEAAEIIERAMLFLEERGYLRQWPETNSGFDGYVQRLAPFTFHLVATEPTIVIMVPHDFGDSKDGRSISQIVGRRPEQAAETRYLLNYIQYGTSFPYQPESLWFSPDLQISPTPLPDSDGGEHTISAPGLRLRITKVGDVRTTRRE